MTFVQLEYIIAVDTHRSFVAAAQHCFVTQPTLSMQIQKLEEALGARLFDRSKQPVVPTDIGREVIHQARIILMERQRLRDIVSDSGSEPEGDLRIGVIPTVAPYLLPKVLGGFIERYPRVHLHVWEYTTEKIIREIRQGTLDCGILSTPINASGLEEIPMFYEPFVAYLSSASTLQTLKTVTASDILKDKLWLLNEGHCMRNQVLNICSRKKSAAPDEALEYNTGSVETLKRMVDTNAGATILPELSIKEFSADELENVRYFKSPEPVREISLLVRENFVKKRLIQALKEEVMVAVPKRFTEQKRKSVINLD